MAQVLRERKKDILQEMEIQRLLHRKAFAK